MSFFKVVVKLASLAALLLILMVVLGFVYPALVWLVSHAIAPWRAEGSLHVACGRVIASSLVAHYNESSPLFHPFSTNMTSSGADPYVPLTYALEQVDRVSNETGLPRHLLVKLLLDNAAKNAVANLHLFSPGYSIVNVEEVNLEILQILNKTCGW
ncbi:potassium-transporting ATPase subunit C [Thermogladius sp.]|uniref:potassium-transporting ATPase subunit C n=1 Tax=Thermogladius sp. TaxID=2023064 RepID=UPI003D14F0C1